MSTINVHFTGLYVLTNRKTGEQKHVWKVGTCPNIPEPGHGAHNTELAAALSEIVNTCRREIIEDEIEFGQDGLWNIALQSHSLTLLKPDTKLT